MSRCECCDKILNDSEATARFVGEDAPIRYVGMCSKCRSFLPSCVQYTVRRDLPSTEPDDDDAEPDDLWDEEYFDDGE